MRLPNILLLAGGILGLCAAALHFAILLVPEWSSIFGQRDDSNPVLFRSVTLAVTILTLVWGLYGLSGAGVIRRLPLLRLGILVVGAVYVVYGILASSRLLGLAGFLPPSTTINLQDAVVVIGALLTGTFYLVGLAMGWKDIGRPQASA